MLLSSRKTLVPQELSKKISGYTIMGVKPNPIKNDGTTITSPQWVSNISQIGVSAFVNDENYISNASINIGNVVYFQNLYASIALVNANLSSQVATLGNAVQSLSNNTAVQISNVFLYVNTVQSNIYSNIQTTSNTLSTSIAILSSSIATNISTIGTSINNIRGDIANIYASLGNAITTSTLQYSNIYSTIANIHPSNLSGYIQYSNLNTIDVRQLSNTSNIVYTGSNISSLVNNSGYITANSSPTFNNITITGTANTQILNATTDIASPMIYSTDIDVGNSIVIGTPPNCIVLSVVAGRDGKVNALQIAQDALGGVSMLMDGLGIASGVLGTLKGLTNASGAPAEDLEKSVEDDVKSGNVVLNVDWASLKNCPMGYTGTIVKDVGIQHDLYMGGSIFYDASYSDITENFNGSVQLNSTTGGVKMIDGQSATGIFNTLNTGDVTKNKQDTLISHI